MTVDLHSLIGPYALGALDTDERSAFEAHLATCPTCAEEVDGFVATSVRLAEAAATTPPPTLREQILAAAATTPQERPAVIPLRRRRGLRSMLPGLVAAAAVLVAAAGVTGYVLEYNRTQDFQAEQTRVEQIMTAPDATTSDKTLDGGATMRLVHSPSLDAALLSVSGLPELDGQDYQLWTLRDGEASSVGVMSASDMIYVGNVGDADRLALTVEPKGGSESPTTAPVASMAV